MLSPSKFETITMKLFSVKQYTTENEECLEFNRNKIMHAPLPAVGTIEGLHAREIMNGGE